MSNLMRGSNPGSIGAGSVPIPAAPAAGTLRAGQGQRVAVLQFRSLHAGDTARGVEVSPEVISASISGFDGTGPLVGIARWASGHGAMFEMEFDIPMPGAIGAAFSAANASVQPLGGIMLAVPASALEIAARNDANMRPRAGDATLGNPALGTPQAQASIAVGSRNSTPLTRTVYGAYDPAGGLAAAGSVQFGIPAFARTMRAFRSATGAGVAAVAMLVEIQDVRGNTIYGPIAVAAGAEAPELMIPATAGLVTLTNTGAVAAIAAGAVFTLAP